MSQEIETSSEKPTLEEFLESIRKSLSTTEPNTAPLPSLKKFIELMEERSLISESYPPLTEESNEAYQEPEITPPTAHQIAPPSAFQVLKIYDHEFDKVYWCPSEDMFYVRNETLKPSKQIRVLRKFNTKGGVQEVEYTYAVLPLKESTKDCNLAFRMSMKDWHKIDSSNLVKYGETLNVWF
jgi:hypothetical protein